MTDRIRRRHVFYISGFDPRGAGHYHRLYRAHARRQSAVNGLRMDVSLRERRGNGAHAWRVRAQAGGEEVDTQVEFLVWDDIVRAQWDKGMAGILQDLLYCLRVYVLSGLIGGYAAASPRRMVAAFYPIAYILLAFVAAAGAAYAAAGVSWLLAPPVFAAVLWGAFALGHKIAVFWLLRIYAFSARWAEGRIAGLDARMDAFARRIREVARAGAADEVMVVGHSVGTMLCVPVLARVLEDDGLPAGRLSLVTLGQCIPLVSFQKGADAYRRDLRAVAHDPRLLWADYTAPADGICFPRLDPVAASGIEVMPGAGPRLLSTRFFDLYSPRNYRRLRRRWYTMHFLYLMSTDYAGAYDYFAMTAGPQPLSARIGGA